MYIFEFESFQPRTSNCVFCIHLAATQSARSTTFHLKKSVESVMVFVLRLHERNRTCNVMFARVLVCTM